MNKGGLHIDDKIVGLSISQWLPCPLAIWNLLFGVANILQLFLVLHAICLVILHSMMCNMTK